MELIIKQESITDTLRDCEESLLAVTKRLVGNPSQPPDLETILTLCSVHSAIRTMRLLSDVPQEPDEVKGSSDEPISTINDNGLEDDNPEEEDKDLKQQREDNRSWLSR